MKFYGELLIFVLLLIINARVFFPKNGRRDPLVAVSPFAVILSILLMLSWGFDSFTFIALVLSILVMLTNFHAMFRYSDRLYIDTYSPLMKFWAVITTALSLFAIVITIFFAPVFQNPKDQTAKENKWEYTGNIHNGFTEKGYFDSINAVTYEYSLLPELQNRSYAVLFLPDRRGDVEAYKPYLKLLAQNGCTVFTADFYTSDCRYLHNSLDNRIFRRTFLIIDSVRHSQKFNSQREFYTYNMTLETEALLNFAKEKYGPQCKFFIVSDLMGVTAASDIQKKYPDLITGIFDLSSVEEYKTAGYGFVAQTEPLLAKILGVERDSSMKSVIAAANESAGIAKASWGIKQNDTYRIK